MQFFPLRTTQPKKVHKITRDRLLDVMKSRGLKPGKGRKFAVAYPIAKGRDKVKICSPKDAIRLAVRNRKAKFSGGTQTNEVFKSLGFPVGKTKTVQERTEREATDSANVPKLNNLIPRLFRKRWERLPTRKKMAENDALKSPGVYVLAFDSPELRGKKIEAQDVWYVGMTNEGGLSNRLGQFLSSATGGFGHSAGLRFKKFWLRRRNAKWKSTDPLFAYVEIPCETEKPWRSVKDLRRMGTVAALEYEILAKIKERTGFEPVLNKK
jgi:hypothetical protein